jgi:hypothetical protein
VGHHRFKTTLEVVVAIPNAGNEPAGEADQELINSLTRALTDAAVGKVKAKRQSLDYTVERVRKA